MSHQRLHLHIRRPAPIATPFGLAGGPQTYRVRVDDGPEREVAVEWDAGAHKLLKDLAYPSEVRVERAGAWLTGLVAEAGWGAAAAALRAALGSGATSEVVVESDALEVLTLPWGLLPLGERRLGGVPGVRVRLVLRDARQTADAPECAARPGRVGLAWSAAGGPVSEAAHVEGLQRAAAAANRPLDLAADVMPDASLEGLSRWLQRAHEHGDPIRVLHLLCRAAELGDGRMGLLLNAGPGSRQAAPVTADALEAALVAHADMTRLVVISAVADDPLPAAAWGMLGPAVAANRAGVPAVIGSRMPLSRSGSTRATAGLYDALLRRSLPVAEAFDAALRAVGNPEDARDHDALTLLHPGTPAAERPLLFRPWPGLRPLQPHEAHFLRGRDEEIDLLQERIEALLAAGAPRVLVVAGGAGTGRTSLVQAGLRPRLARTGAWRVSTLRPAGDVEARLGALASTSPPEGGWHLVVVDPFEAVFSLSGTQRGRLVRTLWKQATAPQGRVALVLVLRIDFLGRCGELVVDDAGTRLDAVAFQDAHQLLLRDPGPRALLAMIAEPAAAAGLDVPEDVAARLASAVGPHPPPLGHLAAALDCMWAARDGRTLGRTALRAAGDVGQAIAHVGDRALRELGPREQEEARTLLRALITPAGPQGPAQAMWRTRASLRPHQDAEAGRRHDAVVAHLLEHGILVTEKGPEGPGLALAHELLATAWPALHAPAAAPGAPPPAPANAAPRRPRRARSSSALPWLAVFAASLLVAVGVLAFGFERRRAHGRADAALEVAADVTDDPTAAAVVLRFAAGARDHAGWLRQANLALQEPLSQSVVRGLDGPVEALSFSPDSRQLLTLSGGIARLWSLTNDTTPTWSADGIAGMGVTQAAFRPDGVGVLLVTRTGVLMDWEPERGSPRRLWSPEAGNTSAAAVAIGPTAHHVLIANEAGWTILDHAGAPVASGVVPDEDDVPPGAPRSAAINADGTRWAIAHRDGRIWLWNAELPDPARVRHPGVEAIAINREGTHLLSVGDGRLRLTDLSHMRGVTRTPTPVQVRTARFSGIGRHVLVDYTHRDAGTHHTRTLSVDLRSEQFETAALRTPATSLLLDEARDRLIRGRDDGRIEELDGTDGRVLRVLRGHRGRVTHLVESPDGRWLASAAADQTARVWSTRTVEPAMSRPRPAPLADADVLVLDEGGGAILGRMDADSWVAVDLLDPRAPAATAEAPDTADQDAARASGVAGTDGGVLRARDGEERRVFADPVQAACASPDGARLAGVSDLGEVAVWDRRSGSVTSLGRVEPAPGRCRMGPTGDLVLTRGRTEVHVWDAAAPGAPVLRARAAPELDGPTAALHPTDRALLTLDESGVLRRWSLDSEALAERLWGDTPTCGGRPGDGDDDRFCACEACFGRYPDGCGGGVSGPLDTLREAAHPGICPGS